MSTIFEQFRIEVHNPEYQKSQYFIPNSNEPKELWGLQQEAFEHIKDERFSALIGPCGCGKSFIQVCLATYEVVKSHYQQKQLIVVPQEHIADGFARDREYDHIQLKLYGKEYDWKIQPNHNFCRGANRTKRLKKWLLDRPDKLNKMCSKQTITGLNAVCTHSAFCKVWNKLSPAQEKIALQNLTLRDDEFHHTKHVVSGEEDFSPEMLEVIDDGATQLGRIVSKFLNGCTTSNICMSSATGYCGDRKYILLPKAKEKFVIHTIDWIKHFNSLGIEHFDLSYEEYVGDPISNIIKNIKKELNEHHLIVIPSSTHKWRIFGSIEPKKLFEELRKIYNEDEILDLVTQKTQKANKKRLLAEPKTAGDKKSKIKVVVMCMLGREGTDWCPCSRLHNTSCENSITLAVQTMGRALRKFEGKTTIKVIHYVPQFKRPSKKLSKTDLLTDRTNAILVCMQLDDMANLILLLPKLPQSKEEKSNNAPTTIVDVFGDQWENVQRTLFEKYEELDNRSKENIQQMIYEVLDEYNVTENRKDVMEALAVKLLRVISLLQPNLRIRGIDVSFLRKQGYGILEKNESIYFRNLSKDEWKILRGIVNSWMEMYNIAKKVVYNLD